MEGYIMSVTGAALMGSILMSLCPGEKNRKLLRLMCGIFFTVTVLQPLPRLQFPDLSEMMEDCQQQSDDLAAMGRDMALQEQHVRMKQVLEAYILDKAEQMGLKLSVSLSLDSEGLPVAAEITGEAGKEQQRQLQQIITNDLGIPGEAQKWIRLKESGA